MTTSTRASATLLARRLRGPTLLASGVVTAILAMALLAWIAPPAGLENSSTVTLGASSSVGVGSLTLQAQSLLAAQTAPRPGSVTVPGNDPIPPARDGAGMAYDAKDGYVVMFGGQNGSVDLNDTWIFVAGAWEELHPAVSPSARYDMGMAYDAKARYVVLFGGFVSYQPAILLNDTWKFVAGQWTELTPKHSPPRNGQMSMVYDAKDRYIVMFGGQGCGGPHVISGSCAKTWIFARGDWTRIHPATSPPARRTSSMAYDAKDGYVLLFGGTYTGFSFNDTWKFVGGVWTNITTSVHPPGGGQNGQMTYDATDGYVVDFCGSVAWGLPPVNVTWDFVGGVWTNITTTHSPPTRWDAAMTFDPKTGYVLLFGGTTNPPTYNDTWKFVGGVWTYLS